ncbi:MAG: 2-succinyl-5-enolpyruvyl-6-hydroxy-3-cyclohexene-1-carboxylic-acid synthase [Cyanobacteriota bacterium]|nr:2-succinyl-5-enolpyruvyl-6-hydroxy-3-cyclohexene-1-carboxylic-acid synthase [Cyanobacteriota bacterium]
MDFRNTNSLWASVLIETLYRLGCQTAVICPGSRSTPLAVAAATHPHLEAIPVLDERSAAFFALGLAQACAIPTLLICTSGTAAANFYPAVIESHLSRIPLLVLTADRPPELRDCQSGQTIDQLKLYGHYPNWQAELALPSTDSRLLAYLRQTLIHAWNRCLYPQPGSVHLNVPLRDPLAPIADPQVQQLAERFSIADFFAGIQPGVACQGGADLPWSVWQNCPRGVIVAGPAQPADPEAYCRAVGRLSQYLGWPVLAEGLSPLRNYADLNPFLISMYDAILQNPGFAATWQPDQVIRLGSLPTSKSLRQWLASTPARQWLIDPSPQNGDPLHTHLTHLILAMTSMGDPPSLHAAHNPSSYLQAWCQAEKKLRQVVDTWMEQTDQPFEGKIAWLLSRHLPAHTPLFIANSMPVRDVESFWQPNHRYLIPSFNRGANGIDGTLSTAIGVAHNQQPSLLLTGDLALLHDTNGFLLRSVLQGHLTILVINNRGGGIFETLPIAHFDPPFERFFAMPQDVDFQKLAYTYGIPHQKVQSWDHLLQLLDPLSQGKMRILEIETDRKADALMRQTLAQRLAALLDTPETA